VAHISAAARCGTHLGRHDSLGPGFRVDDRQTGRVGCDCSGYCSDPRPLAATDDVSPRCIEPAQNAHRHPLVRNSSREGLPSR
jgi:hypothetical protein